MNKITRSKYRIINSSHLRNIFEKDYYLELGIISVDIIKKILNYEVVDIKDVTFLPIQNKGLGHGRNENEKIRNNLPYYFFRKFQESNSLTQLVITYGLCYYRDFEKKDKFAPIIFIPINMYYENGNTYIKMTSRPFENPAIYDIFKKLNKLQFIQNENFHDIYSLDNIIFNFEKVNKGSTRLDNFLTFVERKKEDIIIYNKKKFDEDYDDNQKSKEIYYSRVLTREQKNVVDRAFKGNDISFTGFMGTGKTTVLQNIIVNALLKKEKVLYLSNSRESIQSIKDFMNERSLGNYYIDLCKIYPEPSIDISETANKIAYTKEEEIKELEKELSDKYTIVNNIEKEMNKMYADFKLVEAIKNIFLVNKFEEMASFDLKDVDNLDYLYKNEYLRIHGALQFIESNSQKITSFKDSVWNQIPYINNIKYVNQVINIVFQLDSGFKTLKEKVHALEEYGIKKITSFSGVKRVLDPIEKINVSIIPSKWIDDYSVFIKAKEAYHYLEKEIDNYQNLEYDLSTKYINLNSIDINKEISYLYGDIFTESDDEKINSMLENIEKYYKESLNVFNLLDSFKDIISKINEILDWDFFDKDISINDINALTELLIKHPLSGKLLAMISNNKDAKNLSRLEEIYDSITSIQEEISHMFEVNPKLNKLIKNNPQSQVVQSYNQLLKKMNKLEKEYFEICDNNYHNHKEVLETIRELKKYYLSVQSHGNRKKIFDFILSINKNNRKESEKQFKLYHNLYDVLIDEINNFEAYGFVFDDKSIVKRIEQLYHYAGYLKTLYESKERIVNIKVNNNNNILLVSEYKEIKNIVDNFDTTINNLRNNNEFKYLYEFLYVGEQTNYKYINKVMKSYESFIELFETYDYAIKTIKEFDKMREVADSMNALVETIGGNLRLYSLIFKDSVSRYYFSNIDQNIEYLNGLLEGREELVLYLNITKGLAILNEYKLDKLIEYIVTKDKVSGLSNFFTYKYFNDLINKVVKNSSTFVKTSDYLKLLDEIMILENKINKLKGDNIIYKILLQTPTNIKTIRQTKSKARVILSTVNFAEDVLRRNRYDVLIVDDAHLINEGRLESLFRDNQMIICGDYQSNKVVNQNLIAFVTNKNTDVFRSRLQLGPRKLTYNMVLTKSPYIPTYEANRGIKVVKENIEEEIFNLFIRNNSVKINYYVKDADRQYEVYEKICEYFYGRKVKVEKIINFINNNMNIVELEKSNYIHSDYDIIDFLDYYKENSQIMSNNYLEKFMISKKGLIILDENDLLDCDLNYCFYNRIKEIYQNEKIFLGERGDDISQKIANLLIEKGFDVYYPSNGVNLLIKKKQSQKLYSLIILFSNGFVSNVSSNYRFLKSIYEQNGHKIILKTMLDLTKGPEKFIKEVCEEIDD